MLQLPTQVAHASASPVSAAVAAARLAAPAWAALSVRKRARLFQTVRAIVAARAEDFAQTLASDNKPAEVALAAEVLPLADACQMLARHAPKVLRARRLGRWQSPLWLSGVWAEVRRAPLGVTLIVGPGNYPLFLPGVQALQSLCAGNAVLVKPAPGCGPPMGLLKECLVMAGLAPDLFQVLAEETDVVKQVLNEGVDKVFVTGSFRTGQKVLAAAARAATPVVAELSGCDASIVLADADLDRVARSLAYGLCLNGGATCMAPRTIFVPRAIATRVEALCVEHLAEEPPARLSLQVADHARQLIDDALESGARILTGGAPTVGERSALMSPTLLAGVRDWTRLGAEDCAAPLAILRSYELVDEAVRFVRQAEYALSASVFGSESEALRIARLLPVGAVAVNDLVVPTAHARLPFGGRRHSGFGVTRGDEGLLEHTTPAVVVIRRGRWLPHLNPSNRGRPELLLGLIRLLHSRDWQARLKAIVSFGRKRAQDAKPAVAPQQTSPPPENKR